MLPNTSVVFGQQDGAGCDTAQHMPSTISPRPSWPAHPVPDQHLHEHATCYNLKGRGLVVITSCGHAGILNTCAGRARSPASRRCMPWSAASTWRRRRRTISTAIMAELKAQDIDHVFPMHCSGPNFLEAAKREMPQALVLCTTGSRFAFGA